jgi:exonuclease I
MRRAKLVKSKMSVDDLKIATLAKYFNVEINAHEALSDIRATIEIDK